MNKLFASALVLAFLAGCATRGANYIPLADLKYKDQTRYYQDVNECQQYARQSADPGETAVAGAVVGALIGAAIAPRGHRNRAAAYGAGIGAISGGAQASETQEVIVKRCLAGRGYNVLN